MWFDHLVATCVIPLAVWILVSGLDDLWIDLVFLVVRRKRFAWPAEEQLATARERRVAILVPLWREHRVVGQMLEHNLAAIRYGNYEVFAGVYPNDPETERAVEAVAQRDARVHVCQCPHEGPTSKGDCLNWIYRAVEEFEAGDGRRFDIVLTHDAEDVVHPESLRLINWFSGSYEMVQVPVLPLASGMREVTHGLYCDEFAEFQTKDIPVRQYLGGFLPGNGVGTGFAREVLERLAAEHGGCIFDPDCLTEDYENGYRVHALGYRQVFLPIRFEAGQPVATREYFPRRWRAAVRQRSRWVMGIALQGWRNHGWAGPWRQLYWFWRDRKGLVGNLLSPFAVLALLYGAAAYAMNAAHAEAWQLGRYVPAWVVWACRVTAVISVVQAGFRMWCSARIYGWRAAAGSPVRTMWGNLVNFAATMAALRQFAGACRRRRRPEWRKTEHVYPRPRLGDALVQLEVLARQELEEILLRVPKGVRLGEYLIRTRRITEEHLYAALSLHTGMPAGAPARHEVDRLATRVLPAETMRRWRVMPYRVETGQLHVLTTEVPSDAMTRELAGLSALQMRFRLVSAGQFLTLAEEYLPRG